MSESVSTTVAEEAKKFTFSTFISNLIKLVPVELTSVYALVQAQIPSDANIMLAWILIGFFVVLVPLYLVFAAKVTNIPQVIMNTFAMIVFMLALGGIPFNSVAFLQPWFIQTLMVIFIIVPPIITGTRLDTDDIPVVTVANRIASTTSKTTTTE